MESKIKWQTGKPKENGSYLVTFKYCYLEDLNTGERLYHKRLYQTFIGQTYWEGFWHQYDDKMSACKVIAWCKISDIKPYKE
jgi:hypothetical protein